MWRVVHGVGPGQRPDRVREGCQPANVGSRSDRVRRDRKGEHARAVRDLRLEILVVELEVGREPSDVDHEAEIVRELEPG